MARKYVYKITYPNGKIYIGMDLIGVGVFTYFGSPSPKTKERIAADLAEYRLDLMVRKQILWESDTATDAEVGAMERLFIRLTGANNPAIGYNLSPRWKEAATGPDDPTATSGHRQAEAIRKWQEAQQPPQ